MNEFVARVHLNSDVQDKDFGRQKLIDFCLSNPQKQYLAIGWSCAHPNDRDISSFSEFYDVVSTWCKENKKRIDTSINLFKESKVNDLFWTRDLSGHYWICRAKADPIAYRNDELDIGALLPVEAYQFQLEVPGQIKAAFNRINGGVAQRIYDKTILNYSKFVFNKCSGTNTYVIDTNMEGDIISYLPDFELEELVISYIQIQYDYYVLSNSIANKSTTIAIECEFMSRNIEQPKRAVVQVKGEKGEIDVSQYKTYIDKGYEIFFYSMNYKNRIKHDRIIYIERNDLLAFYQKYKVVLPESITYWEDIFVL